VFSCNCIRREEEKEKKEGGEEEKKRSGKHLAGEPRGGHDPRALFLVLSLGGRIARGKERRGKR